MQNVCQLHCQLSEHTITNIRKPNLFGSFRRLWKSGSHNTGNHTASGCLLVVRLCSQTSVADTQSGWVSVQKLYIKSDDLAEAHPNDPYTFRALEKHAGQNAPQTFCDPFYDPHKGCRCVQTKSRCRGHQKTHRLDEY